jgi:hypothetical protein
MAEDGTHLNEGGSPEDSGAREALKKFLDACARRDEETALECLAEESRDGFNIDAGPQGDTNAQFGEEERDGEFVVIPTKLTVDGLNQEMPFSMKEEGGQWRLDMMATMERLMGFDPEEMVESMGQAMADGMESLGDALASGFESMGEAMGEAMSPVDAAPAERSADPADSASEEGGFDSAEMGHSEWKIPIFAAPDSGERGMQLLRRIGRYFDPPFAPGEDEYERTSNEFEGGSSLQARYGDESAGFFVMESENGEDFRSVTVIGHGLPDEGDLQLQYMRVSADDNDSGNTATIRARSTAITRRAMGAYLSGLYGIED